MSWQSFCEFISKMIVFVVTFTILIFSVNAVIQLSLNWNNIPFVLLTLYIILSVLLGVIIICVLILICIWIIEFCRLPLPIYNGTDVDLGVHRIEENI